MAKIRGFLQGAKGKIGDFVVQKGEMGTILRANNGTANPQSAAQMAQRLAFATATNAAKKMLSVIGLSFYGVSDGKLSRRKFVQLNVPILKASADAQISGEEWTNPTCHFKAKDVNQLVPNPYIVSDGSLVLPEQWDVKADNANSGFFSIFTIEDFKFTLNVGAQTITGASLIDSLFGCSSGDQITLVSILAKSGEAVPYEYEQGENVTVNGVLMLNYDWMRFTRMYAPRIVFKRQDLADLEIVEGETYETLLSKIQACVRGCIDMDKSSLSFVEKVLSGISAGVGQNIEIGLNETYIQSLVENTGWSMLAAGIVRSANVDGVWDFSRCQLKTNMDLDTAGGPEANDNYSGLHLGNAIYTYVGVADSTNKNFMTTGTPFDEMPQQ